MPWMLRVAIMFAKKRVQNAFQLNAVSGVADGWKTTLERDVLSMVFVPSIPLKVWGWTMSRPFVFRINAAELFAEVQSLHHKQRSSWILKFSQELLTLKPTLSYSEKVISEAIEFMDKKRVAGLKGGRPQKTKGLAEVKQSITNAKPKTKPETETETEHKGKSVVSLPEWLPVEEWQAYSDMRKTLKKPMTEYAQGLRIKDLERLRDEGHNPADVLNQSIANSWTDIYPLKPKVSQVSTATQLYN